MNLIMLNCSSLINDVEFSCVLEFQNAQCWLRPWSHGPPKFWRLMKKNWWNLGSPTLRLAADVNSWIFEFRIRDLRIEDQRDRSWPGHPSFLPQRQTGAKMRQICQNTKMGQIPLVFVDVALELKWLKLLSIRKILFSWCHIVSKYEL